MCGHHPKEAALDCRPYRRVFALAAAELRSRSVIRLAVFSGQSFMSVSGPILRVAQSGLSPWFVCPRRQA